MLQKIPICDIPPPKFKRQGRPRSLSSCKKDFNYVYF